MHECIINLRLKTITARPSHFRTVELGNFMAYLDTVVVGFEDFLFRKRKATSTQIKRFTCQRAQKIYEIHSAPQLILSFQLSIQNFEIYSHQNQTLTLLLYTTYLIILLLGQKDCCTS